MGLGLAVMSLSRHIVLRQLARFYIEIVRGIPIIVLLLYVAFVLAPGAGGGVRTGPARTPGARADPGAGFST